ncbi:DUF2255 family protein [Pseudosporangium ferrugineum]|uniref:DUF2255 family protein n=1 Tax=Pseudosporangium ferrugineum TaxID=439699 RepID=A0A2T0SIB4_9ACTN|nr:DUF2255 family protein [Pseudosporangium ferrugineum]PRY33160.1 hypothetical protein CLV70_101322 [Pseudosporangium ferrugineum]
MTAAWSPADLRRIDVAGELLIAARRADGTLRRRLPIWVVTTGGEVYVRTWYRRDTGWFGHVRETGRAAIRVPGLDAEVTVEEAGAGPDGLRTAIDAAYRAKYGRYGAGAVGPMVTPEAAATTLRLRPE